MATRYAEYDSRLLSVLPYVPGLYMAPALGHRLLAAMSQQSQLRDLSFAECWDWLDTPDGLIFLDSFIHEQMDQDPRFFQSVQHWLLNLSLSETH